jgi:preprotein translocase subunit YajC
VTPLAQMLQLVFFSCLVLGAVYFIFYRPTVEAENRQRRVVAGLRVGDEVVTTSGFIARVVDIREPDEGPVELLLDLGSGLVVRARTSAIADRLPRPEPAAEPALTAPANGRAGSPGGMPVRAASPSSAEGPGVPGGGS